MQVTVRYVYTKVCRTDNSERTKLGTKLLCAAPLFSCNLCAFLQGMFCSVTASCLGQNMSSETLWGVLCEVGPKPELGCSLFLKYSKW